MVKITYVDASGVRRTIDAKPGQSVMQGAVKNNVPGITADCGGSAACATCRVYVDEAWRHVLGLPTEMEQSMIEYAGDSMPGVRLSCQIEVTQDLEGLVVHTPEQQHC